MDAESDEWINQLRHARIHTRNFRNERVLFR